MRELPTYADVVIVGAGAAGLTAGALLSTNSSMSILVVESEPFPGGSSLVCGGQFAVSGTDLQADREIIDSESFFIDDLLKVGQYKNDYLVVESVVRAALRQYRWLIAQKIFPVSVGTSAGMSRPRAHFFRPPEIISRLTSIIKENKGRIVCSARAERLLLDSESGAVGGIELIKDGRKQKVSCRNVILASGGFSRNKKLLSEFAPGKERAIAFSGTGSRGDGLVMGLNCGADIADIHNIKITFGFSKGAGGTTGITGVFYSGAIAVNQDGKRFVDESLPNKEIGEAAAQQEKAFLVFDEEIRRNQMRVRPNDRVLLSETNGKPNVFSSGQTIEEAARKAHLDPQALKRTLEEYNRRILEGLPDEQGRTSLSSGWGKRKPIEKAPFYIMPTFCGLLGTYGGLKVDSAMRVLKKDGTPIGGLFAAGEVTGGFHGEGFMAGSGFGKANAMGRICAETLTGREL